MCFVEQDSKTHNPLNTVGTRVHFVYLHDILCPKPETRSCTTCINPVISISTPKAHCAKSRLPWSHFDSGAMGARSNRAAVLKID